jgi:hypothetical protein
MGTPDGSGQFRTGPPAAVALRQMSRKTVVWAGRVGSAGRNSQPVTQLPHRAQCISNGEIFLVAPQQKSAIWEDCFPYCENCVQVVDL